MRIIHNQLNDKADTPKAKQTNSMESAKRWVARQRQANYDEAVKKHSARIEEIQKHIPGWMPPKNC